MAEIYLLSIISDQIILFHHPGFPSNTGISLHQLLFGVSLLVWRRYSLRHCQNTGSQLVRLCCYEPGLSGFGNPQLRVVYMKKEETYIVGDFNYHFFQKKWVSKWLKIFPPKICVVFLKLFWCLEVFSGQFDHKSRRPFWVPDSLPKITYEFGGIPQPPVGKKEVRRDINCHVQGAEVVKGLGGFRMWPWSWEHLPPKLRWGYVKISSNIRFPKGGEMWIPKKLIHLSPVHLSYEKRVG